MSFDHIGVVADNLGGLADWYLRAFGWRIAHVESVTPVDPTAIGLPDAERVTLQGAVIHAGGDDAVDGPYFEIHQFLEPTGTGRREPSDTGLRSLTVLSTDVAADVKRLSKLGLQFHSKPQTIAHGPHAGGTIAVGLDPWANQIDVVDIEPPAAAPSVDLLPLAAANLVVADLPAAVEWFSAAFGCARAFGGIQPEIEIDGGTLGLPGESVRVQRAFLDAGGAYLQLEHYPGRTQPGQRRVCDTGFGHICFRCREIQRDFDRLRHDHDMRFFGDEPRLIPDGGLKGHWWIYGEAPESIHGPDGRREIIQLNDHPAPPPSVLQRTAR